MNELLTLYKDILTSMDCTIDENNVINYQIDNNQEPKPIEIKVNNKLRTLVLPTDELRKKGDWNTLVGFHPACESPFMGQSEVLNILIYLAGLKIYTSVQKLVGGIINLGLNPKLHTKLDLAQAGLLERFDLIDEAVEKLAIDVANKNTGVLGKFPLISFKLERGLAIDDIKYNRTCKLVTHVINKDTMCGVSGGTINAKKTLKSIYEYVLPHKLIKGSNNPDTPYIMALLSCFRETAIHLNVIKKILKTHTPMELIPLDWYHNVENLHRLGRKYLPSPLEGNIGLPIRNQPNQIENKTLDLVNSNNKSFPTDLSNQSYQPQQQPVYNQPPAQPVQQPYQPPYQQPYQPPYQQPVYQNSSPVNRLPTIAELAREAALNQNRQQMYPGNGIQPLQYPNQGYVPQPIQPQYPNQQFYPNQQQQFNTYSGVQQVPTF